MESQIRTLDLSDDESVLIRMSLRNRIDCCERHLKLCREWRQDGKHEDTEVDEMIRYWQQGLTQVKQLLDRL